ncbi:MAG: hypothetical protein V4670_02690 [Bacteroidota bacterium]
MKKGVLIVLSLLIFNLGFSQNTEIKNSEYYLQKRRTNITTGWICIGLGVAGIAGGLALDLQNNLLNSGSYDNSGLTLSYIGGGLVLTSIPLFAAANKNKKKAANATLSIKNSQYQNQDLDMTNHPNIVITIQF